MHCYEDLFENNNERTIGTFSISEAVIILKTDT